MGTKTIDIIVLEEEQAKRIRLAEFTLDELPYKSAINRFLSEEELQKLRINYGADTSKTLLQLYLEPLVKVQQLFSDIFKDTPQEEKASYENIAAVPFAFASVEAYNKIKPFIQKEKDSDAEIDSVGHFNGSEIIISLRENHKHIHGNIAHEHGHHMHWTLHPKQYHGCDPTLRELIAIFVQEKCGYSRSYAENTMHHRALQLLHELQETERYRRMPASEQWKFLNDFSRHETLRNYIRRHTI